MQNLKGWFVWCGVGTIDEEHEKIQGLSKKEALITAKFMAEKWPRVLVGQVNSRYPHGVELGGIEYGRKSGICL